MFYRIGNKEYNQEEFEKLCEEKAIKFLESKTTKYSLSGEELHYYNILYYLIINLKKENKELNKKLQKASDEFLKYDWANSTVEQCHNQLKNLYEAIFRRNK